MKNIDITEAIENSELNKLTKYNLQQIANFIDFVSPNQETNEYYTSLVYLLLQDLEKRVEK